MTDSPNNNTPLCVDLDGTLVITDTLIESAVLLAKKSPFYLFAMLYWLLSGKANLKQQIAQRTSLDVALLPYNQPLLEWLQAQRQGGRELVLATASNVSIANAVANHLQLFSAVIASTHDTNLSAARKRDELVARFGDKKFDYVGNSEDDLSVWSHCRRAVLVNTSDDIASKAAACADVEERFSRLQPPLPALLSAMRPHQWAKNMLVFVSIVVAHEYTNTSLLLSTIVAFIAFCLCSSAVYLINDLLDLQADRQHVDKHKRPFASGRAPLLLGVIVAPLLLLGSAILAWLVGPQFCMVLLLYFGVTLAYSFYLKRVALLDVIILAILFTLRIIAGASVAGELPSVWLVSFSMFLFTSLAMAKRYAELKALEADAGDWARGRGYHVSDLEIISQLGAASGYIATLVLALYIDSPDVAAANTSGKLMWLLCPLLMYWIGRIWLIASRGMLQQDPVIFATRDKASYLVFLLGMMTLLAAR